jgi:pyruvate,water dikinase
MVAGIDVILYRPDAELRTTEAGRQWLAELDAVKDPWLYYSTGSGYCHAKRAWIDDLRPPFAALADYVRRLERGEDLSRPLDQLRAERERIAGATAACSTMTR